MNTYELIVNNTILDTNNNIDISINYSIDDILDISKRNTSWTKTIVLPGTPINNKFFSICVMASTHCILYPLYIYYLEP